MNDILSLLKKASNEVDEVIEWSEELYNTNFATYFNHISELYVSLSSGTISDDDLQWILVTLPLEMFAAAEALTKFKTGQEVLKFNIKKKEREFIDSCSNDISESRKKELASQLIQEDKLLVSIHTTIIERVEKELSYCRELIMGAKKIWDSRRSSEAIHPTQETDSIELPEYKLNMSDKLYIR